MTENSSAPASSVSPTGHGARKAFIAGRILQIYAEGGDYSAVVASFGKYPTRRDGTTLDAGELISWAIDAYLGDDAKRIGAARLVAMLEDIAGARIGDFIDWTTDDAGVRKLTLRNLADISRQDQAAISAVKQNEHGLEIKFENKLKAAELLGRIYGVLIDRAEVDVNITAQLAERLDRAGKRITPVTLEHQPTG